jgi:hypothetical protein
MIRQLKREGAAARSQRSKQLCDKILRCVDGQRRKQEIEMTVSRMRVPRATRVAALTSAAAFLVGLGVVLRPAPPLAQQKTSQHNATAAQLPSAAPVKVAAAAKPAEDLFAAPTAAVESLTAWQACANPLDEFQHDAQLAGQMALSTLPLSEMATD